MNLITLIKEVLGKKPAHSTLVQICRYICSGGLAFVFDYVTLYILTEYAGFHYLVSSACGFSVGLVITYILSIYWIFDEHRTKDKIVEFSVFLLIGLSGILLNIGLMWVFTSLCSIYYMLSKLITTIIVFVWNFIFKKKLLFTQR
ncbi:MAG: GtrA family protein [Bacteroidia bacterium]|nr:GtrA family protein [Bacteroidia bacterium]